MFKKLPIDIVNIIISYIPDKIRYKIYDKYKLYDRFHIEEIDQNMKLAFVYYNCFNLLKHFGAPFNKNAIYFASYNGNLEMVKWLYSQGSDWHNGASYVANVNGHTDVLNWLSEYQPDCSDYFY